MHDRFLKALKCQPVDRVPVWLMRQAGRYLPEYKVLRKKSPIFLDFCKTLDLVCLATLQPLDRFNLDAAIIFSDILVLPDAMGLELSFIENKGPVFNNPIRNSNDIRCLKPIDPNIELKYVADSIRVISKELTGKQPLIGFSGSPWTLSVYMVEGKSSKTFSIVKGMLYKNPDLLHKLLNILTSNIVLYLKSQIDAGAQSLMIFDTWGGLLAPDCYRTFSLKYINKIIKEIKKYSSCPIIVFSKNTSHSIKNIANSGCDAISIDWSIDIDFARSQIGNNIALQGNLDPCVLYAPQEVITFEVNKILEKNSGNLGYIFNLGHGIYPDINPNNVQFMLDTIRNYK